jgi:hypothetical protein
MSNGTNTPNYSICTNSYTNVLEGLSRKYPRMNWHDPPLKNTINQYYNASECHAGPAFKQLN